MVSQFIGNLGATVTFCVAVLAAGTVIGAVIGLIIGLFAGAFWSWLCWSAAAGFVVGIIVLVLFIYIVHSMRGM